MKIRISISFTLIKLKSQRPQPFPLQTTRGQYQGSMAPPVIEDIIVKDVEKRKSPSKHYAYIIEVKRSDGSSTLIGRRYSDFFDFQMALLDRYPIEGGQNDPSARVIPFLPGKILFGRSNTRDVALKRLQPIGEYCTGISKLPEHILEGDIVQEFFKQEPQDMIASKGIKVSPKKEPTTPKKTANKITGPLVLDKYVAIAEYKKEDKKQLSLKEGEVVEVVEKKENGWWLAANEDGINGWVPGVFLESLYGEKGIPTNTRLKPGEGESYTCIADFQASTEDELSFKAGEALEVLEKNLEGWWFATGSNGEGWVPTTYLQKMTEESSGTANSEGSKGNAVVSPGSRNDWLNKTKRPPPKRSTVRRTLTKAAVQKVQNAYKERMIKQASLDEDDEEFAGIYTTIGDFRTTIQDGISFSKDETVYVTQKSSAGWWYGRVGNKHGWIPETYLKEQTKRSPKGSPTKGAENASGPPVLPRRPGIGTQNNLTSNGAKSPARSTSADNKPPRPMMAPQRPPLPKQVETPFSKSPFRSNVPAVTPKMFGRLRETRENKPAAASSRPALPSPKKLTPKPSASLTDYNWYKDINRQEAEGALEAESEEGYFIIRPSQRGAKQGKPYSLTLFHKGICWNFHIRRRNEDQKYAVGVYKDSEPCFTNLPELVEYYAENHMVIGNDESKVKLVDTPQDFYDTC